MNDTLRTSNKVNIILIILFILFIVGVIGYIVVRQRSATAGEFPNVSADSLVSSNASLTLSGPEIIADAGSDYDLILDTKGEVVSSINVELALPAKDISLSVAKGSIANFTDGSFSSSTDTSTNTAKIQLTTNANTTFNGAGILAKITLKRLPTSTGSSVAVSILKTSYLKLVSYSPKGFTAASARTYNLTITGSTNVASSSSTATQSLSTATATPVASSTATPTPTVTSTATSTATPVASSAATPTVTSNATATATSVATTVQSTSTATATIVAQATPTSTSTATTTKTSTAVSTTKTSTATAVATTKVSTTVASSATTSGTLPVTSVDDNTPNMFLYLALASLATGLGTIIFSKKNSLRIFERSFEN